MAFPPFPTQFTTNFPAAHDGVHTRLAKLEFRFGNQEFASGISPAELAVVVNAAIAALGGPFQPMLGFTPEDSANKSNDGTLAANSATLYPTQQAVKTYADTKQAALGFTPENVANKDIDGTLAANSDVAYPSQKAVKTYADTKLALTGGVLSGDLDISTGVHLDTDGSASFGVGKALFSTAGDLSFSGVLHAGLRLNNLTTAERDALASPTAGMLIWNTTTGTINQYTGSGWASNSGGDALTANPLSQFAATTSAQFAGVISDETGTGLVVLNTDPTIAGALFSASVRFPYTAQTTNYNITSLDTIIDVTANTVSLNLPTAIGITGRLYIVKNSGTGSVALVGFGGQTIDGQADQTLAQNDTVSVISNGANWEVVVPLPVAGGDALTSNPLSQFAATTSAQLRGVISDEVGGAGLLVFNINPSLTGATLTADLAITTGDILLSDTDPVINQTGSTRSLRVGIASGLGGQITFYGNGYSGQAGNTYFDGGSGDLTFRFPETFAYSMVLRDTGRVELIGTGITFDVYNFWSSAANFERLTSGWTGNVAHLWTEKGAGGGAVRAFALGVDGLAQLTFNVGGDKTFVGAIQFPYVAKVANYTATAADYTIDCTANTFTVTLPTAVGITGRVYNIKNSGVGVITVDPDGAELIDGLADQDLVQGESAMVQSNGAGWIII